MGHGFNPIFGNINYVTHTYLLVCKGLFLDKEEKQGGGKIEWVKDKEEKQESKKIEKVKQDKEEKQGGEMIGTI